MASFLSNTCRAWSLKILQLSTTPTLPLHLLPLSFFASGGYCTLLFELLVYGAC